jgi:hypothetical protein
MSPCVNFFFSIYLYFEALWDACPMEIRNRVLGGGRKNRLSLSPGGFAAVDARSGFCGFPSKGCEPPMFKRLLAGRSQVFNTEVLKGPGRLWLLPSYGMNVPHVPGT